MRCRKVRSFLSTFYKKELDPALSGQISSHLEDCPACRRETEAFLLIDRVTRELPHRTIGSDFSAKLFDRIAKENFAEKRTKAYFPRRIPIFGATRLTAIGAVAMIALVIGVGTNITDRWPSSYSGPIASTQSDSRTVDNSYLTAQPTNNPLLNDRKTVSRMIQQYNRWREFAQSLRSDNGSGILNADGASTVMASSGSGLSATSTGIRIRPVVKNYLAAPEGSASGTPRSTY